MAPENEVVITGLDNDTGELSFGERESDNVDEVTKILSGPKESSNSDLEKPNSQGNSDGSGGEKNKEDVVTDPALPALQERLSAFERENKNLSERLAKFEGKDTEAEIKAKEEAYNKEIQTQLDDALEFLEPEKREKVLKLFTKLITDNVNKSTQSVEEKIKIKEEAENESKREMAAVVARYNGNDGVPTLEMMAPLVKHLDARFGSEEVVKWPIHAIFRAAENVPFMLWLEKNYPNNVKGLNFPQMVLASEAVRQHYYKNKEGAKPFDHLNFLLNSGSPSTESENNTDDLEERANNLKDDAGVSVSAGASTLTSKKVIPAGNARDVIARTLRELNVG